MKLQTTAVRTAALIALGTALAPAHATNGYFPHGYGLKAKGMGGAAVALSQDAFAGANNPAAAAFAGNRWDLGAEVFMPNREVAGLTPTPVESDKSAFLIPEFGYNMGLSDKMALGVTVYGNGGMNTSYPTNFLGGTGKLGVDLIQLVVAPTFAYKLSDKHSLGLSPLLVYQRFEAYGLQGFGIAPNPGTDSSTGLGVRLGYMGKLSDMISVGASYSPKINMSKFDKYAGLFADAGDFDIPENYAMGVAIQATPSVLVALDYQRINYSGVAAISNLGNSGPLGAPNGAGFGWKDVNVVKLGVQWQMNNQWTLRAGYNHGTNPIDTTQVTFNTLAPGVIKSHITLGATYAMAPNSELTFAYMHAKKNTVSGSVMGNPATIGMSQNGIGMQYSRKF